MNPGNHSKGQHERDEQTMEPHERGSLDGSYGNSVMALGRGSNTPSGRHNGAAPRLSSAISVLRPPSDQLKHHPNKLGIRDSKGGNLAEAHGNRTRQGRFSRPSLVLKTKGSTSQPDASAGRYGGFVSKDQARMGR